MASASDEVYPLFFTFRYTIEVPAEMRVYVHM